jgi:LPS-assembly protein
VRIWVRPILTTASVAFASAAWGQVDLSTPINQYVRVLRVRGAVRNQSQSQNPVEPTGFPAPGERNGALPPPRTYGPGERTLRILSPNRWSASGSHVHAENGIHAVYRGYDIFGSTLDGDTQTEIFTLTGDVRVIGLNSVVTGESVTVNFRDSTFKSTNSDVQLRPGFLQGRTREDVYVRSLGSYGSEREIFGEDSSVTTCNLDEPHYQILADTTDVRPGRRIVMRGVTIQVLKHNILRLPYLSIPLDQRLPRYIPEVGHSQDEGYYVKFRIPVALKGNDNFLDSRVDYFTKLGAGLGLDYDYRGRSMDGRMRVYGIFGGPTKTLELEAHHNERFGRSLLNLDANFQRGNYLTAPDNTLIDTRAALNIPQNNGTFTRFSFFRSSNTSQGFDTVQQVLGMNDSRIFTPRIHTNLELNLSDNHSSFSGQNAVESKQLDVRFSGIDDLKKALAELDYIRSMPIGQTNNFFATADRTPVFYLRTDSSRLFSPKFAAEWPMQAEFSTGNFSALTFDNNNGHITRTNLDISLARPDHPQRRFDISANGRFIQGIYSDNTAQYVTNLGTTARYNLGRDTGINVRYEYLQPHGYTPLEFDRPGRTNVLTTDMSVRPFRNLLVGAQTGYDFLQREQDLTGWQSVGLRAEYRPLNNLQFRSLATYDTFLKNLSNVRFDMTFKPGATYVGLGVRYDNTRSTLGEANLFIDALKWGRLRSSILLDYNGYIRRFDARHFAFTYDLHCAELIVQILDNQTGFRPGTTVSVFLRLKAFPFDTPFGIGRRGQVVGGGTGRDFY